MRKDVVCWVVRQEKGMGGKKEVKGRREGRWSCEGGSEGEVNVAEGGKEAAE